jgi:hypothetical protein
MPLRRLTLRVLVAFMTSLSMLHFALEGSGVVCSSGAAGSAHGAMATSGAGSHAGHAALGASLTYERSDAAQQESSPHAPSQERCCGSMSSCGVTTVVSVVDRASVPLPASTMPAHVDAMLASVGTAPEPPPPKA